MRLSIIEGTFAIIALGLQQTFFVPYLNAMGASKLQIGIGAGLPALVTGLIQIWIPQLLSQAKSYKKIVALSTIGQALCFGPFALMVYIVPDYPVWPSIAAITVSALAMGVGAGAWADWMSHIVPRRRRGKYFATRNRIVTVIQLVISIIAGRLLDGIAGKMMLVFTIIWFVCLAGRMVSGILFMYHYEPAGTTRQVGNRVTFTNFIRQIFLSPFGKFAAALAVLNFAVNFSGPSFAVYMLNDLKMSYIQYTVIYLTPAAMTILSMGLWGRICDKIGYVLPTRVSVAFIAASPLPWIFTQNYWLLLLSSVIGGIAWAGFTLASFNYTIGAIGPVNRLANISYLNAISSICICMGTVMGGLAGPYLPKITEYPLHSVFLCSTLIRTIPFVLLQFVVTDKPKHAKMSTMERFFFDPRMSLNIGFFRGVFSKQRRL